MEEQIEGITFEEGVIKIRKKEMEGKTAKYVEGYIASVVEINKAMGEMYSQKAVISLEGIEEKEKLRQAIGNGKARKIISEKQYKDMQIRREEIERLREEGIEIYVADKEIKEEYKEAGISGLVIKEEEKIYMYDYYGQEEIEMEVVTKEESMESIENKIKNSQKPVYIDIKVLEEKFKGERDITNIHEQLGQHISTV